MHFLVGGCLVQRSLYFSIFSLLNFSVLCYLFFYLSVNNFIFSILLIRRVFEGFRDPSEQQKFRTIEASEFKNTEMSAVTASLCSTLLFVGLFVFVSAAPISDQKSITAITGLDVTLTCRAPNNNIIAVEWSRADLGEEYVLLCRDGHFEPTNQHPSFKNRVYLQNRQMKDGDVSLILKDVTINDAGAYECRVFMEETHSWKPISIIDLRVDPPGQTGGHTEVQVGLHAVLVLVAAVAGFCLYRQRLQVKMSQRIL
ncbi:unnamed protein product [Oreochromis niloticus]|nr:unnamed protein product [Mustela putorius furo]